ncbi:MAG TPA: arylsulfatase [Planctomycetaceae bacterium]|nr:arylsulfatase [Planctomycetaceae bacterium]
MNRRQPFRAPRVNRVPAHLISAILLCVFSPLYASESQRASRPNIVIIYTDDQGYGDAGCYNPNAKFSTPNIDSLAAGGIVFTDGHSADAVCTPSRYALLTGRYCWRTSLKRGVLGAEHPCLIPDHCPTLATMLRDAGYETAMVGKWHLGMDFPGENAATRDWSQPTRDMPLDKGFNRYFGVPASLNYGVLAWFNGRYPITAPARFTAKKPNLRHVDYRIKPPYELTPKQVKAKLKPPVLEVAPDFTDNQCLERFTDEAIRFVNSHTTQNPQQPFFLYLPLTSPHYPVCPLPQFHGQGECGGYGEFMIETDHRIGQLLNALKSAGVMDDTLILFSSDNGPERSWEQRATEFGHSSNGRLRDGKRSIYEGGHRVPFIAHWPGGIKLPGRKSSRLVCQTDYMATIAELLGIQLPESGGGDSVSFAGELLGSPKPRQAPLMHHAANGRLAIRLGRWKLVLPHKKASAELYDLEADLGESHDLGSEFPDDVARLTALATKVVVNGRTTEGPAASNDTGYWSDLSWMKPDAFQAMDASQ